MAVRRHTIGGVSRRLLLGVVLLALAAVPAIAGPRPTWQLDGSDSSYSYVCGGDDWVAVNGKNDSLTITGECAVLEINGSDNKVTVESVGTITIRGNNNDVRYTRAPDGKHRPLIKNRGVANTIHQSS